jgi:integrase
MGRPRKGSVYEKKGRGLVAQLDWIDEAGQPRQRRQQVENKSAGWALVDKWKKELDEQGESYLEAGKITFAQLAEEYKEKRLIAAEYRDGKKVKGLNDWKDARRRLKMCSDYFGKKRIRKVTYADIENFRNHLLATPVVIKKRDGTVVSSRERSIADVNRILARLSGAMTYAIQKEWIIRSPFTKGEDLIDMGLEVARDRVLSTDEQSRLLHACQNKDRRHLFPIILTALDSGCRLGELLSLTWENVDLERGTLRVTAMNAKTNRTRVIDLEPITVAELRKICAESRRLPDDRVFGIKTSITTSWRSAKKAAEITIPTRFHDLRATAITFWLLRGMPMQFAMRRSGHSDHKTFMKYIRSCEEIQQTLREQLREWELASSLAELAGSRSQ